MLMSSTYLPERCQLHDDPDGRVRADADEADDVRVVKLLHDICQPQLEAGVHRIPRALAHTFVQKKKKKNPEFDLGDFVTISLGRRRRRHF